MAASGRELFADSTPASGLVVAKARIAAAYAGLDLAVKPSSAGVSAPFLTNGEDTAVQPSSSSIAKYISQAGDSSLCPKRPFTAASSRLAAAIDGWLDWSLTALEHGTNPDLATAKSKKEVEGIKAKLLQHLAVLEAHLAGRTYLAGEALTLADVALAVDLKAAFEQVLDPVSRQTIPHSVRWFSTVTAQPHIAAVLGPITLAEKTMEPAPPPTASGQGKREKKADKKGAAGGEAGAAAAAVKAAKAAKAAQHGKKPSADAGAKDQKETKLGLTTKKAENFGDWYSELVRAAELISYSDVSGCYILRPWSYAVWESIQRFFDGEIKKLGVQNAYFPLFVTEEALNKEQNHVEGFAAEVAWVTKSGQSELERPIAIRPTSETVMYPLYAQWVQSHRDLPLRLNQWTNIVRWEFKHPTPFIRSREFLWQEGHTAFATKAEADAEVMQILDLYRRNYEDLLAVPVIKGIKSEKEKFAGALYTTTVEAFIPTNGRGVQGGTSHCLGQNFSKMFGIEYEAKDKSKAYAWQNSWGFTTRSIGVAIMIHGDDKGMVMPPRVAPLQVMVIPIPNAKMSEADRERLLAKAEDFEAQLKAAGVRVQSDTRDNYTPGWKYNHWELKGVPLRLELGPKDLEKQSVVLARRDTGAKDFVAWADVTARVPALLEQIQDEMFARAKSQMDSCIERAATFEEFMAVLDRKHMVLTPWCETEESEEDVKKRSATAEAGSAKTLCIPLEQPDLPPGTKCFVTGAPAKRWALWGRSY